ncbi:MAG TPA: ATP-grasp ribosomal peptide maturase [Streptosporangiaceae bacterium]
MTVLVLTDEADTTADRVLVELAARGVPAVRVAPSDFPVRVALAAGAGPQEAWSGCLIDREQGRTLVDLTAVRSVYYRRPNQFRLAEGMSGPEKAFAYGEARRGFGGVLQALDGCLWVNDPVAAARCEYKPVQLAAAVACGLEIPETLITSDPARAHQWATMLDKPIIYKPMSGAWPGGAGTPRMLYTSPVADLADLLDPALGQTAHLLQEQVPKLFEVRAMVTGGQVLSVAIHADSEQGRIDWWSDYDCHRYEVIELPAGIRESLVQLHRRLGLVFGAADLVCEPSGRIRFLETNQCGEWGWLATETGLPVAAALAGILEEGATPS